jgi:hypothetical protein
MSTYCPKVPELVHTDVQPGLHVSIELHNSSISNLLHADAWVISRSKNMQRFGQRFCGGVESN